MKKIIAVFFILMLLTGCGEQPVDVEQTAEPTAVPTPIPTEFVPAPLEPAELTQEQWEQMQQTTTCMTADGEVDLKNSKISAHILRDVDYYGTYQGYIALRIHKTEIGGNDQEEVAGCTLYYSGFSDKLYCRVLLWKDDTFYHLRYAYDQGLITAEDVKTIAYYNNLGHFEPVVSASPVPEFPTSIPENFVPKPLEPAELSEDVWTQIEKSYQYVAFGNLFKGPTLEFHRQNSGLIYHGTYQGYIAIYIRNLSSYDWGLWLHGQIYLWKDGIFYIFQDALNMQLITDEDAQNIIYYHNTIYRD